MVVHVWAYRNQLLVPMVTREQLLSYILLIGWSFTLGNHAFDVRMVFRADEVRIPRLVEVVLVISTYTLPRNVIAGSISVVLCYLSSLQMLDTFLLWSDGSLPCLVFLCTWVFKGILLSFVNILLNQHGIVVCVILQQLFLLQLWNLVDLTALFETIHSYLIVVRVKFLNWVHLRVWSWIDSALRIWQGVALLHQPLQVQFLLISMPVHSLFHVGIGVVGLSLRTLIVLLMVIPKLSVVFADVIEGNKVIIQLLPFLLCLLLFRTKSA